MILIFEGPDLSGKSTLAEQVSKKIPNTYMMKMCHRPKDDSLEEREGVLDRYRKIARIYESMMLSSSSKDTMVLDRFYPSEAVYSYKRGYDMLDDYQLLGIDGFISDLGGIIIYCDLDLKTLYDRFLDRGDDFIVSGDLPQIQKRYLAFLKMSKCRVIYYNTSMSVEELIEEIQGEN